MATWVYADLYRFFTVFVNIGGMLKASRVSNSAILFHYIGVHGHGLGQSYRVEDGSFGDETALIMVDQSVYNMCELYCQCLVGTSNPL